MKPEEKGETPKPARVRLPGFVREEEIGLGDLVSRTAAAIGVRPCGGCGRRAEAMNRWMSVGRRTTK